MNKPFKPQSPPIHRKPIFDAVRRLLGRGFKPAEVDALDDAIDTGLETRVVSAADFSPEDPVPSVPSSVSVPLIRRIKPRAIGADGIALIKRFEGCARQRRDGMIMAYPDPGTGGDPWTIGWGATGIDDQTGDGLVDRIGPGTVWTRAQCDARLASDLKRYAKDVERAIGSAPTTQAQFDAMVSFHYNTGAIGRATLTRKHVAGDIKGAEAEFARWNMAGGQVLKGLVRRRSDEAKLYAGK